MTIKPTHTMNKDRRQYEPQDAADECQKTDRYERELERADFLRAEMKDREWERAVNESERRRANNSPQTNTQP